MTDKAPDAMPELERWGLNWKGHDHAVSERVADGYWTPWHIADAAIKAMAEENKRLRGALEVAALRFEYLALGVTGVASAECGAREASAALKGE